MKKVWVAALILCAAALAARANSSENQDQGQQTQQSDDGNGQDIKDLEKLANEMRQKIEGGTQPVRGSDDSAGQGAEDEGNLTLTAVSSQSVEAVESPASLEPLQTELESLPGQSATAPGAGPIPLESYVHNLDPQFNEASALLKGADFQRVKQQARAPLESQWGTIQNFRADLLQVAPSLDSGQAGAIQERDALKQTETQLISRKAQLDGAIANFNSTCVGRMPLPQYNACMARKIALQHAVDTFNADVNNYNAQLASWKGRVDALLAQVKSWSDKLDGWAASLNTLIDQVKQEIAKADKCTEEEVEKRRDAADKACKKLKNCVDTDHCADISTQLKKNKSCLDAVKELNACLEQKDTEREEEAETDVKSCQELFDKNCSDWDPDDGNCTKKQHDDLQAAVKAACKAGAESSCDGVPPGDCVTLKARLAMNTACYNARDGINAICFDGGDQGHREAAKNAQTAAIKCLERIKVECQPNPNPPVGEPGNQ